MKYTRGQKLKCWVFWGGHNKWVNGLFIGYVNFGKTIEAHYFDPGIERWEIGHWDPKYIRPAKKLLLYFNKGGEGK